MKSSQVPFLPLGIGAVFVSAITFSLYGQFLQGDQNAPEALHVSEAPPTSRALRGSFERSGRKVPPGVEITEAPTGFDNLTNGFDQQGPPFEQINLKRFPIGRRCRADTALRRKPLCADCTQF